MLRGINSFQANQRLALVQLWSGLTDPKEVEIEAVKLQWEADTAQVRRAEGYPQTCKEGLARAQKAIAEQT